MGRKECRSILPILDLMNHSSLEEPNVQILGYVRDKAWVVVAQRDIEAGEELTHCYGGDMGNDDLLMQYGFIEDENEYESVECSVSELEGLAGLEELSKYLAEKRRVLEDALF